VDAIIGALLATRTADLGSPAARARAAGQPLDTARSQLFDRLAAALDGTVFSRRPERTQSHNAFRDIAFFESYFSNYIEGTEFEVGEAADIVCRGATIPDRAGDSHDIRGTFALCGERAEMSRTSDDPNAFVELLWQRHRILLGGRPEKEPGVFKNERSGPGTVPS